MTDGLFGGVFQTLERALDVRAARHSILAANIANSQTPGYRALDVDFQTSMRQVLDSTQAPLAPITLRATDPRHFSASPTNALLRALKVISDDSPSIGNDQNTVDLEREMAKLEHNALMFNITAEIIAIKFRQLRDVISEGGIRR